MRSLADAGMSGLETLAEEAGLQIDWVDAAGTPQRVSADTLRAVLAALGFPGETDKEIEKSRKNLAALRDEGARRFVTGVIGKPVQLPADWTGAAELVLENGEGRSVQLPGGTLEPISEPGYHRLSIDGEQMTLAVAPERCFGIADLGGRSRMWGAAVQLPSLRSSKDEPFGDFGTLRAAAEPLAAAGADALAISPVHALFPSDPGRFSPYGPSSRRFLNVLFADPSLAGHPIKHDGSQSELIDWEREIPRRMEALRAIYDDAELETAPLPDEACQHHALFDALDAHFRGKGIFGWQDWPEDYRSPNSEAVAAFANEHAGDVGFYAWLQHLAADSLDAAQQAARDAGMAIGLIGDLAVGTDPGGSDCWTDPEAYLRGLSVGAPPDLLGPEGQDWGLTTFNPLTLPLSGFAPFRETLAAAMENAGGVRIDHVLGLRRIWVVPQGRASAEGCYLTFPQTDLFRILALESWRRRAVVVGEDLGTVPEGLRGEMEDMGILGMRVLWFERDEDGAFTAPSGWDVRAAAMTSTHDLPTVAGWWSERDIDWTWRIGRKSRFDSENEERQDRADERERLWRALVASGKADGAAPPPAQTNAVVTAAAAHVASSGCDLALIPAEDILGLAEQPNLPGTLDEHPNWRRRLPQIEGALCLPHVIDRLRRIDEGRGR